MATPSELSEQQRKALADKILMPTRMPVLTFAMPREGQIYRHDDGKEKFSFVVDCEHFMHRPAEQTDPVHEFANGERRANRGHVHLWIRKVGARPSETMLPPRYTAEEARQPGRAIWLVPKDQLPPGIYEAFCEPHYDDHTMHLSPPQRFGELFAFVRFEVE